MGIVNVTSDSFSDGGRFLDPHRALDHAAALLDQGADILDVGAESTRPGARAVPASEEIDRLGPVVGGMVALGAVVSVDTRKPDVMRAMLALGAHIINDVAGFRTQEAIDAVAGSGAGLCVMHMLGDPTTMQVAPTYAIDVVEDVSNWLAGRVDALTRAGVSVSQLCFDPGIGFGKTQGHNITLFRGLRRMVERFQPIPCLMGVSRKTLIGELTGQPVEGRLAGSLAAALAAAASGARILRVHDVASTRDGLRVFEALGGLS